MTRRQFLMAKSVRQGCPASGFLFAMAFDPSSDGSRTRSFQATLLVWTSSSRFRAHMLTILWLRHPFVAYDHSGSRFPKR